MKARATLPLLITIALCPVLAAEELSPEGWVDRIRDEAAAGKPSKELQSLRLAAGVYMTHGCAKETAEKTPWFNRTAKALEAFMQGRGKAILAKSLSGASLDPDERPFRIVVLGCWLKAGYDAIGSRKKGKKASHELYLHDILVPDDASLEKAADYHDAIVTKGPEILLKGYLKRSLSVEEIDVLRLYRIAQGLRGVGETFLPMHLGIHPRYATGRIRSAGHGHPQIEQACIGTALLPLRMPILQAVRNRARFDDAPCVEYGFRYPLLPEGVLEFLEPMTGYEPGEPVGGKPVVRVRKDLLRSAAEAGVPEEQIRLTDLSNGKPLLLYVNDAVDAPLTRAFALVPTLMKAWREHADWAFVQVNIHDWFYASGEFKDYLDKPRWYNQHHAWSEEERARRISMRLVQNPQNDAMRILIDTRHHLVKDRYSAGGGQNSYWLFDRDGVAVHKCGGPFIPMGTANMMEHALSELVASGCRGPIDIGTSVERGGRGAIYALTSDKGAVIRKADPYTTRTEDPVLCLKDCSVAGVSGDTIRVLVSFPDGEKPLTIGLTPHARIEVGGKVAEAASLKPGMHVALKCRFSDMGFQGAFAWPDPIPAYLKKPQPTATVHLRGITLVVRPLDDGYRFDHVLLEPASIAGAGGLTAFWVLAARSPLANTNPAKVLMDTIWRGGTIRAIDADNRTLTVMPWAYDRQTLDGRQILRQWKEAGRSVHLDAVAKQRHACVKRWLENEGSEEMYRLDDAVVYTLNGRHVASFEDLRPGDKVTIRYRMLYDRERPIPASMVRISRPAIPAKE
jgi:hypothetical protein